MQFSHVSIGGGITGVETIISIIREIEQKINAKNKNYINKTSPSPNPNIGFKGTTQSSPGAVLSTRRDGTGIVYL